MTARPAPAGGVRGGLSATAHHPHTVDVKALQQVADYFLGATGSSRSPPRHRNRRSPVPDCLPDSAPDRLDTRRPHPNTTPGWRRRNPARAHENMGDGAPWDAAKTRTRARGHTKHGWWGPPSSGKNTRVSTTAGNSKGVFCHHNLYPSGTSNWRQWLSCPLPNQRR